MRWGVIRQIALAKKLDFVEAIMVDSSAIVTSVAATQPLSKATTHNPGPSVTRDEDEALDQASSLAVESPAAEEEPEEMPLTRQASKEAASERAASEADVDVNEVSVDEETVTAMIAGIEVAAGGSENFMEAATVSADDGGDADA